MEIGFDAQIKEKDGASRNRSVRFGRLRNRFDPRVPHWSAVRFRVGASELPALPSAGIDYTAGQTNFGDMGNYATHDCCCAAFYHSRQIWSLATNGVMVADTTADALSLYSDITGYNPQGPLDASGNNITDSGADENTVLQYLLNTGAPIGNGNEVDRIEGYIQIDQRTLDDLRYAIWECGAVFIGFAYPTSWTAGYPYYIPVWDANPADPPSQTSGHGVILVGWSGSNFKAISWGKVYTVTSSFIQQYVDEAFAIIDNLWLKGGNSPAGLTAQEISQMMEGIKADGVAALQTGSPGDNQTTNSSRENIVIQRAKTVNFHFHK